MSGKLSYEVWVVLLMAGVEVVTVVKIIVDGSNWGSSPPTTTAAARWALAAFVRSGTVDVDDWAKLIADDGAGADMVDGVASLFGVAIL